MKEKWIALTFDDGPSRDTMPRILDLLARYSAKATFFIWGEKICPETEEVLRRAVEEGHELGNHTMHHCHMAQLTRQEMVSEVEPLQEKLRQMFGAVPVLFRPPYLQISEELLEEITMPFITGTSNRDWTPETDAAQRLQLAKDAARDNAILLMHCFSGNHATVLALEELLPWLREQGYGITSVGDLFARRGILPEQGKIYSRIP